MTRLKKLEIEGFRSLKEILWEPKNLNVIIGENGSGKSNLLKALELLHQSSVGRLRESILAEGGLSALLWNHASAEIRFSISSNVVERGQTHISHVTQYDLGIGPNMLGGNYVVENERLIVDADSARTSDRPMEQSGLPLELEREGQRLIVCGQVIQDRIQPNLSGGVKPLLVVPPEETAISKIGGIGGLFFYFGDMFEFAIYQEFDTRRGTAVRNAAVTRFEQRLDSDGQNLASFLHTLYEDSRDFKRILNDAMIAAFGNEFEELSFGPAADQKIQLRVRWKSLKDPTSAASLSDGTLRFLMLVAALANPDPPPLIAIDEPEAGLHPRMFPIIAELAAAAAEKSTVILTTHSPQFLDAFPDDCVPAVTVAELQEGATHLTRLDGADLKRWLKDYSLGQMFVSGELEALAP